MWSKVTNLASISQEVIFADVEERRFDHCKPLRESSKNVKATALDRTRYLLGFLPLAIFFLTILIFELVIGMSFDLPFNDFLHRVFRLGQKYSFGET